MIYEEAQRFSVSLLLAIGLFVVGLAGVIALLAAKSDRLTTFALIAATLVPICALFLLFRLDTRVSADGVAVRLFPFSERVIPRSEIASADIVQYSALRDFGGWGIRYGRGGKIYNARGDKAVKLTLVSGDIVYVGTERPDDLLRSLGRP
jgi:hypothetical protein